MPWNKTNTNNNHNTTIMKKRDAIIYYIATGLITLLMLFSASMYFIMHDMVVATFEFLGYPSYLIYPLAIAKLLGLVAIWTNKSKMLKEWAYAGFVFDLILGGAAHIAAEDGGFMAAVVGLVLIFTSYIFYRKLEAAK